MCVMRRERINLIGGNLTPRWVGARLRCVLLYSQVRGGELYFHLRKKGTFSPVEAQFFAAELTLALGHLHSIGIVYRAQQPASHQPPATPPSTPAPASSLPPASARRRHVHTRQRPSHQPQACMHSDGHGVGDGGDGWRQAISSPRMCWSAWTATSSSLTLGWPRRTSQKPTNRGRSVGLLCASLCGIVLL
eukprot:SAG25_NODE_2007_length_2035_cov_1.172521_5_plen_191_part_00